MTTTPTPGRRRAAPAPRRSSPAALLLVVLPVAAVLLALLVDPDPATTPAAAPPETRPVSAATVVCPSAPVPGSPAAAASLTGEAGDLDLSVAGGDAEPTALAADRATDLDTGGDWFGVTGREALAPLLLAGRFASPAAAADCREPVFDTWFTGVGAGATHRSVLELANPDRGRAVVDVRVLGRDGPVDAPDLLGLAVPGRDVVRIDLATTLPRADDLALRVQVVRGRASAHLEDTYDEIGSVPASTDWLPGQDAPAAVHRLVGLPEARGSRPARRQLVIANPGDDEGSAVVRLLTGGSTFAPDGVEEVRLPPRSVVRVDLTGVVEAALSGPADGRALGVEVESTVPTTADLVQTVDGDLAHASSPPALAGTAGALLPIGPRTKTLVLAGASGLGAVTVTVRGEDGEPLDEQQVDVDAGRGVTLDLTAAARVVEVVPDGVTVQAAVVAGGRRGSTVVVLREPVSTRSVPDVRPS